MASSAIVNEEEKPCERSRCLASRLQKETELESNPEEDLVPHCAQCGKPFRFDSVTWQDFCSHRFCGSCFDDLRHSRSQCPACKRNGDSYEVASDLHFPDKSYLRMKGLKVKCSFDPPCGWVGEFNQVTEHEGRCENRKLSCANCGARVLLRQMRNHVTVECRHRRVTCHHCQFETTYSAIIEHERSVCPFYHYARLRHISNFNDDVIKGIWILQKAMYQRLDSGRHLPSVENMTTVKGVTEKRRHCLQFDDEFHEMRAQLEGLKSNIEDLIHRTDLNDFPSRLKVNQLREDFDRFNEECIKLQSFNGLETGEGYTATIADFGKLQISNANELDNSKSEGCQTTVGSFGKDDPKERKKIEAEVEFTEQEKDKSTAGGDNSGHLLKMEKERQDDVNEEEAKMESSQQSEETDKMLPTEQNDTESTVNKEIRDVTVDSKTPVSMNQEMTGQRFKGGVELTKEMEKLKGFGADEISGEKESEGKTEQWNEQNLANEKCEVIIKHDNRNNAGCCPNVFEEESCPNPSNSCYGSSYLSTPNKQDPCIYQAKITFSNESTEPASQDMESKKKNKRKKSVDKDGGVNNNTIGSKVKPQNMLHCRALSCYEANDCEKKVDILERAMGVLMGEMEKLTKTNSLLLILMRDQQNLEDRVSAIEEKRQNPSAFADGY